MNFKTLHICLIGLHPLKSYDNIVNLVYRILKFDKGEIDFKINILHDTGDKESYLLKDKIQASHIGNFINWVEYESNFLKSGRKFLSRNYASLIVQNEPIEAYLQQDIPDTDLIFRCRSDYYLTDEFLKMILEKQFYLRLDNSKEKNPILINKLWMPYIGTKIIFDCCDYFFIVSAGDQRKMLITSQEEATSLWYDSFINTDRSFLDIEKQCFAERVFFIKPFLSFLRENKINRVSEKYWDLIHSNFSFGGDPSPIKTCFYGWRKSAWCFGKTGYKTSELIDNKLVSDHSKSIAKCSKVDPSRYEYRKLSKEEFIY